MTIRKFEPCPQRGYQRVERHDHAESHQAQIQPERAGIVRAEHDMVHVPHEPGEGHHGHMADEEGDEGAHDEEVE